MANQNDYEYEVIKNCLHYIKAAARKGLFKEVFHDLDEEQVQFLKNRGFTVTRVDLDYFVSWNRLGS